LSNSKRAFQEATYVPATITNPPQTPSRVSEKVAYVRMLSIQKPELDQLRKLPEFRNFTVHPPGKIRSQNKRGRAKTNNGNLLIDVIDRLTSDNSPASTAKEGPMLAQVSAKQLARVGNAVAQLRSSLSTQVRSAVNKIIEDYKAPALTNPTGTRKPKSTAKVPALSMGSDSQIVQSISLQNAAPATAPRQDFNAMLKWAAETKPPHPQFLSLSTMARSYATSSSTVLVGNPVNDVGSFINNAINDDLCFSALMIHSLS
jgi:hypothetical protein